MIRTIGNSSHTTHGESLLISTLLALVYHPDRNPGRETEVIAKFQRIQSANEVLTDPTERAKYDQNRISKLNGKGGFASGVRGNPWSNVSSQWAPPPKRPSANRPPPPSAGAARYGKFETPKASANTAYEGAEARKKTYEAWESMRSQETRAHASTGRTSYQPPPPRRDYTTPSGRDESNSYKHPPPPKAKPGFDEYRANYSPNVSPHRRAQSSGAANRKGFTPSTPGGDEPAAPKGAYFTQHKSQYAPEPPPRAPPTSTSYVQPEPARQNVQPDPLRQFRQQVDPQSFEARQSTPYQTHGGEKLNPFDNANLNRSKSHRDRSDKTGDSAQVPRTGSDPNMSQPHRSRSFADRPSRPSMASFTEEAINSSSSDDGPQIKSPNNRKFAQPRRTPTGSSKDGRRMPEATEHSRKPSLSQFQKWYRENPGAEPPLNGFPSGGPSTAPGQTKAQPAEEPNMYGTRQSHSCSANPPKAGNRPCSPIYEMESPERKDSRTGLQHNIAFITKHNSCPSWDKTLAGQAMFPKTNPALTSPATPPSGVVADSLNSFEASQRRLVDQIISKRQGSGSTPNSADGANGKSTSAAPNGMYAGMGSPSKKQRFHQPQPPASLYALHHAHSFLSHTGQEKTNANDVNYPSRFSFKVDDNTFSTTNPRPNGMASPSTENINTKFTPEEWAGKFEAGQDYFRPEQKAAGIPPRGRTQSASRARGRSPIKIRPIDPKVMEPRVEERTPIESPGGTKFTPEEWTETFRPQTFMPPPPPMPPRSASGRKARGPSIRPTMGGNAAIVGDSDNTSDEKPLFTGRRPQPPPVSTSPALDPMEVDSTPPAGTSETEAPNTPTSKTVPVGLGVPSPGKRPAAASQSPIDSALKVEFNDLKLQDLISHLNLPVPPSPPKPPHNPPSQYTRPTKDAYDAYLAEVVAYMSDWDLFNHQFMMHVLARKRQNDELGSQRWESDAGLEQYRVGLKQDKAVLDHWSAAQEKHQAVMKDYAVLKEGIKDRAEWERPRKKTH
jgi:curved DNA-binding protein CbpA